MLVQKNESSASSNCSYFRKLARRFCNLYFYRFQTLLLYTTSSNEIEVIFKHRTHWSIGGILSKHEPQSQQMRILVIWHEYSSSCIEWRRAGWLQNCVCCFPMKISATFWSESEFRIRFQPTFLTAPLHQMAQVWWCSICVTKPLRTIVCRYSFVVGPSQG